MLERESGVERNRKLPHLFILNKTATLVPEFAVEDLPWAELQPWFLRLQQKSCPWAEHSDDDISHIYSTVKPLIYEHRCCQGVTSLALT